jgi:hypothetical protein
VTAFYAAVVFTVLLTGGLYLWARRRPPGLPMSWGEAFIAAMVVFAWMIVAYGILPNQWLQWCTGGLKWRSDKVGIPLGPLHYWRFGVGHSTWWHLRLLRNGRKYLGFLPVDKGLLFPNGITFFGRGKITVSAATIQDIGATLIYVIMIGVQFKGWLWWQKRGQAKPSAAELPTSAYGRPLVRKV